MRSCKIMPWTGYMKFGTMFVHQKGNVGNPIKYIYKWSAWRASVYSSVFIHANLSLSFWDIGQAFGKRSFLHNKLLTYKNILYRTSIHIPYVGIYFHKKVSTSIKKKKRVSKTFYFTRYLKFRMDYCPVYVFIKSTFFIMK